MTDSQFISLLCPCTISVFNFMAPSGNSQSYLRSSQEGNMKNQGFPDYIQTRKKNLSIEWNSAAVVGEIGADLSTFGNERRRWS